MTSRKPHDLDQLAPGSDSPDAQLAAEERLLLLRWCLTRLPKPRHVELLQLRYEHGWTFATIALHFGVGEPAVHRMHSRILVRLLGAMRDLGISGMADLL